VIRAPDFYSFRISTFYARQENKSFLRKRPFKIFENFRIEQDILLILRGLPRPISIFTKICFLTKKIVLNSNMDLVFSYDQPFGPPGGFLDKNEFFVSTLKYVHSY